MDIHEHELVPPAEGLAGRRTRTELTPNEKLLLANWAQSGEYDIFLKLAEIIIAEQEATHLKAWQDKQAFQRTGLVAVAMNLFFERLQKEVKNQYEEFSGEVEFAKKQKELENESPEEMIQRSFQ